MPLLCVPRPAASRSTPPAKRTSLLVQVAPDQPLMAAGLDSLGAVELRNTLEAELQLALPATLMFDLPTAAAIAAHVADRLAGAVGGAVTPAFVAATASCCRRLPVLGGGTGTACTQLLRTQPCVWLPISLHTPTPPQMRQCWQRRQQKPWHSQAHQLQLPHSRRRWRRG